MIETLKDMKHGKAGGYGDQSLERAANQILHRMEDKESEDSLESTRARVLGNNSFAPITNYHLHLQEVSRDGWLTRHPTANARAIYGHNRLLDVLTFAPTSSRKIGAAIVEHNPTGRSYVHCCSAKEDSRLAAIEHLLVITEDILFRLIEQESITSSGWLPATAAAQHAVTFGVATGSAMGDSRRSSVAPVDYSPNTTGQAQIQAQAVPVGFINDHHSPHSHHHIQKPHVKRNSSDTSFNFIQTAPQPVPRPASEVIQQPKPVPVSMFPGRGPPGERVAWKLGSED